MTDTSKKLQSKKLLFPIGVDDYKKLIEGDYLYVDKTLFIKEFWETGSEVTLLTRPRRFGKTISLSMLKYFFEKSEESTSHLFENSQIWQEEELRKQQGTYPVIFISFKDIKASNWEDAYEQFKNVIADEVRRVLKPLEFDMAEDYRDRYKALITKTADLTEFKNSLDFITKVIAEVLKTRGNKKQNTIILIDEYDTPITRAYMQGYYKEMIDFMSSLLSKGLKGNPQLYKGFMTGVVRTAKDGILSGLNNPKICTMLDKNFADKFGFTQEEVDRLLQMQDRLDQRELVKSWYNGYICGVEYLNDPTTAHLGASVYNPWSILNYLEGSKSPQTYWANTGSVELLERLIAETSTTTQDELKTLLEGKSLERKMINQDVILLDLDHREVEPWSFLFFAGYITATGHVFTNNRNYYTLSLPNEEIKELYNKLVLGAISKRFSSLKLENLLKALISGEVVVVNNLLGEFVRSFCSSHDLQESDLERSLHLFVLGLLVSLSDRYIVTSNLESGYGRYDIMLCPRMPNPSNNLGVLLEIKKGKQENLEELAEEALSQIKAKEYPSQLRTLGYFGEVLFYGIGSYKKELLVKLERYSS